MIPRNRLVKTNSRGTNARTDNGNLPGGVTVLTLLLLLCSVAPAATVPVPLGTSYEEGVQTLAIDADTVALGALCSFSVSRFLLGVAAGTCGAVVLQHSAGDTAGFAFSPTLVTNPNGLTPGSSITTGSSDTTWRLAASYPDSVYPLDTVSTGIATINAKWFFTQLSTYGPFLLENWNAIIYVGTRGGRHLKLQGIGFPRDTSDTARIDANRFRVRWAVDSAGDGLFRHDSSATGGSRWRSELGLDASEVAGSVNAFDLLGRVAGERMGRGGPAIRSVVIVRNKQTGQGSARLAW